jgi:hypothetical protein
MGDRGAGKLRSPLRSCVRQADRCRSAGGLFRAPPRRHALLFGGGPYAWDEPRGMMRGSFRMFHPWLPRIDRGPGAPAWGYVTAARAPLRAEERGAALLACSSKHGASRSGRAHAIVRPSWPGRGEHHCVIPKTDLIELTDKTKFARFIWNASFYYLPSGEAHSVIVRGPLGT